MKTEELKELIKRELPRIIQEDEEISRYVFRISSQHFAGKVETEDKFDRMFRKAERDREEWNRKWEANERKYEEENRKRWEESEKRERQWEEESKAWWKNWKEQERKWEEENLRWKEQEHNDREEREVQRVKWEGQERKDKEEREVQRVKWEEEERKDKEEREVQRLKWETQERKDKEEREAWERKWEEENKKWWDKQKEHEKIFEKFDKADRKHEQTLGALGARWGLNTEASFRNALRAILEDTANFQVHHILEFDDAGEVFGRPEQIELDVLIKNGSLIICEIKSSVSRADMYIFFKKVNFYEKMHNTKANRKMVISPMVEDKARKVAENLGVEVYSYVEDVQKI
ncbi:MAG: DUF3782 domain-containing protein [bacterium]